MTVLSLEPLYGRDIDRGLGAVEEVTLVRRREGSFADVPSGPADLVRALAFLGIHAEVGELGPLPPAAVRAGCRGLVPLPRELVIADVVRVRRVPIGEATRDLLRRRLPRSRRPSAEALRRCRGLLRGDDLLLCWRREAWIERGRIRDIPRAWSFWVAEIRGAHAAKAAPSYTLASEGRFGAWVFG